MSLLLVQRRQKLPLHHPQITQQPHAVKPLDTLLFRPLQEDAVIHPGHAIHSHPPLRLHLQEPIQRINVLRQYPERIGFLVWLLYHQAEYRRSVCRILAVILRLALRGSSNELRRVN
jgi:hypothetical protein